ncbi:MAG: EAL domain-containing protein [Paracoccaceae bacterium]
MTSRTALDKAQTARTKALVREALHDERIGLAWQPVMRGGPQGHVSFYEGLLRLRCPNGAVMRAGEFIEAVEGTQLGRALDRRALSLALELLAADRRLRLSINISPNSMHDNGWNALLAQAARQDPSLPERLIIELTERSAMRDPDETLAFLERNRKLGCSFAIDDFGAGQTAFAYFRRFRFDMVKIDGQFIRDLHKNPDNAILVKVLVELAQHFDMLTVAEFVENEDEASAATALGVDCLQGYYCGHAGDVPLVINMQPYRLAI